METIKKMSAEILKTVSQNKKDDKKKPVNLNN